MNLNVLLRGQSNSIILGDPTLGGNAAQALVNQVQQLLGFDGVNDKVTLRFNWTDANGNNTSAGGTALVDNPNTTSDDDISWLRQNGSTWTIKPLEQGLLNFAGAVPKGDPTVVLWLHNEYDSVNSTLTSATWESAVRFDAAQVRAALGQNAQYIFVEPIPYSGGTDVGAQAIRVGMEDLVADPNFNAQITATTDDLNMDATVFGAGGHMSTSDAALVAARAARTIAESFAAYAKPGSAVANGGGNIDDSGPLATQAVLSGARQVTVSFALDAASSLAALDAAAATGLNWSVHIGSAVVTPTSAALAGPTTLVLGFGTDLPSGGILYYGYGDAQTEANGSAHGHAVYDDQGMPVRTPATGLAVGAVQAAAGVLQVGTGGADTLAAGAGGDTIVGGAGADYLVAGPGADTFVLNRGDGTDWIDNFTPGVDHLSFGAGVKPSDITTQVTSISGVSGLAVFYNGQSDFAFLARVNALGANDLVFDDASVGVYHNTVLLRGAGSEVGIWQMSGTQVATAVLAPNPGASWKVADLNDFNGDGLPDILWRGQGGEVAVWTMNGGQVLSAPVVGNPGSYWSVAGTGDVNGDGRADIVWRGQGGEISIWGLDGGRVVGTADLPNPGNAWSIAGVDDFNGDGRADILLRGPSGEVGIWTMNGGQIVNAAVAGNPGSYWTVAGTGDMNGDGRADILFRGASHEVAVWGMDGTRIVGTADLPNPGSYWNVAGLGDVNGDGRADIVWHGQGHEVAVWTMNGGQLLAAAVAANPGAYWTIA